MRLHSLFYALLGSKNIKVLGKHCRKHSVNHVANFVN